MEGNTERNGVAHPKRMISHEAPKTRRRVSGFLKFSLYEPYLKKRPTLRPLEGYVSRKDRDGRKGFLMVYNRGHVKAQPDCGDTQNNACADI